MAVRGEGAVLREGNAEGDDGFAGGVGELVLVEEVAGWEGAAVVAGERNKSE